MGHLVFLESYWSVHVNQRVCMSFLIGVVLFEGESTLLRNASTLMVCLGKKKLGSTSPWIVQKNWSLLWKMYIPVWPKYRHSSFLSKKNTLTLMYDSRPWPRYWTRLRFRFRILMRKKRWSNIDFPTLDSRWKKYIWARSVFGQWNSAENNSFAQLLFLTSDFRKRLADFGFLIKKYVGPISVFGVRYPMKTMKEKMLARRQFSDLISPTFSTFLHITYINSSKLHLI